MNNSPQKELLDAIDIIAQKYHKETTQSYNGLVLGAVDSNTYSIKVNGQIYNIAKYGGASPDVNSIVKVIVPKNNWTQAYFIAPGGSTSPTGTTNYNDLTNQPQINAVTLSGNKTSTDLGLYGTGNEPPYPVTSVNGATGAVTITVPTKTSELTNDSNFITASQAPVQSVNGHTGTVVLTKSDVGLGNVANVLQYSVSNPPPYPVTSVNTQTGAVSLTTDNVPATTTNRYVPAVPTSNPDTSYLNGNGVFSTLAVGGASSVADVFFSNTASTVSGYKTLNYVADATATELSVTMTSAADVLSATFLYSAPLGVTVIDAGVWDSIFYMKCSTASTGVNRLKMVAFVRHTDGTETDLFTKYSSSVNLTVYDSYYTQTNHPSFAVLATDTLGVRLYGNTTRKSSTTITYTIGGTNASFFNTPLALRHSQLRDLNGDSNYQHITSTQVAQIGTNTTNISSLTTTVNNHIANTSNPHAVTKAQVGLSNVANVLQYSADNPQVNITGNAGTATKFAAAQSIALTGDVTGSASSQAGWSIATLLANSGVTAGSYGLSAAATPAFGGTVNIPYFTIDAKGRVTLATSNTLSIPSTLASTTVNGLMSSSDKTKLNGIESGAQVNTVTSVNSKTGAVVLSASDVGALPSTTTYVSSVNGNSGTVTLSIPTKTSDLTNDSGFLPTTITSPANGQIIAYNGTAWINQSPQSFSQQQSNWAETSTASIQYIQNKPTALSAFTNDTNYITASGVPVQSVNGQTGTVNITTITGNAETATTLETSRTIAISGGATGTATSFNGSQNITIPVTSLDATKLSGTATINTTGSSGSCTGNAATASALTTNAGSATKPVYFSGGVPVAGTYTLANACTKAYKDATASTAISSTGTSLPTERDIYYGLPNINGVHTYTSSTNIYPPTTVGTSGYLLQSSGGNTPSWVAQSTITAGKATADASGNTITSTYAPLASPALTGTPTAPTAASGTSTTQIATTAFVQSALSGVSGVDIKVQSTQPTSQTTGDFWYQIL